MLKHPDFVKSQLTNTEYGKVTQHGFDCTLDGVKILDQGGGCIGLDSSEITPYRSIIPTTDGLFLLFKGVYSVTFNEGGSIPRGYCGWFKTRSSLVRNGCLIESGLYDQGFKCDSFGAILFVHQTISIQHNARVAQFLIAEADGGELYDGQYQKNLDVK